MPIIKGNHMQLKTYVEICDIEHDNVIVDYDYQPEEKDTNTHAGIYINEVKCADGVDRQGDMTELELVLLAERCMEATYSDEGDKADYDHDYREEA